MAGVGDVVAEWDIHLTDGVHKVRFEHGTTSGKRIISVDNVEVRRKNWMFKLVGSEQFLIGDRVGEVVIACSGMTFEYTLSVDGRSLKRFIEAQVKNTRTWLPEIEGELHRIVLDIEMMEVHVDGKKEESFGEFADGGSETHFSLAGQPAFIRSLSSGNRRKGLVHRLVLGGTELEPINVITSEQHFGV